MKNNNGTINGDGEEVEKIRSCSQKTLKQFRRRLPITTWLRVYTKKDFISDLIAGTTVGLTVVPQSMAYAAIAGLSPEYGLYSSYIGVLIYVLLGSCAQATIGPTAVMGLLTFQTCGANYPSCAILTGFYSGIFELLLAVLHLGWVVSFISEPVTLGFTAGAASTIISSQIKSLFGISGEKGSGFVGYWESIFKDIGTIHLGDSIMGITAFVSLLCLRKLKDVEVKNKILKTSLWLISLSRNVIVIIITSIIAYIWGTPPFKLVGNVQGGFPSVAFPEFSLPFQNASGTGSLSINGTSLLETPEEVLYMSFSETWSFIGMGPLVIALISILQNVAISKAFGSGQKVDAMQEMIALGSASVVSGFFSSIPISASFSRSAVNEASGVRTPLGGLFTGILVLLSLGFLTPSFYYIPKSSLAAIIIGAVMFMIEYESLLPMWRISKMDATACLITFISSLFLGMEYGIIIGVGISIGSLLMRTLKPKITSELQSTQNGIKYLILHPEDGINFPSVDHISSTVQKLSLKHKSVRVTVINFCKWRTLDYTAANTLLSLVKGLKKNGKCLIFLEPNEIWINALRLAGLSNPPVVNRITELEDYINKYFEPPVTLEDIKISSNCQEIRQRSTSVKSEEGSSVGSSVSNSSGGDSSKQLV